MINQVITDVSHDLMSCDSILVARLMCMECSLTHGRGVSGESELEVLTCSIQHSDEQVYMWSP